MATTTTESASDPSRVRGIFICAIQLARFSRGAFFSLAGTVGETPNPYDASYIPAPSAVHHLPPGACMPSKTSKPARPAQKISIQRRFTSAGQDPFDLFTWVKRTSRIGSADGSAIFTQDNVEVPDSWDQVATDILASKYFRKRGVPQFAPDGTPLVDEDANPVLGSETSLKQTASRLANAWKVWAEHQNLFATPEDADAYRDEMLYMLCAQMAAPNSPAWFNVGIFESYGIVQDPDGSWYVDPSSLEARQSAHRYERVGVNACYISEVKDQLVGDGSIFDFLEREARLFSQGSGSGANLSYIRAEGERLSAGGTSSGVLSFMKVLDSGAAAIKSGGATRRAAKMVILDADHPEIENFIWAKAKEEKKAQALINAGYEAGYEGEAVRTVAFQNANHSVRITPGFMQALQQDGQWDLLARTDGHVVKTISARQLWHEIATAAWECADPGLQFDDIINDWNTAADTERLRGTNPCFPGTARVHTDQGLVTFDEMLARVQAGESFNVWTFDETNPDAPTKTVTLSSPDTFMITGMNDIVTLTFSNGAELSCTPAHRIFTTNRGFVAASELRATDLVKVADLSIPAIATGYDIVPVDASAVALRSSPVLAPLSEKWSVELAHLLGFLSASGGPDGPNTTWVYNSRTSSLSSNHETLLASLCAPIEVVATRPNDYALRVTSSEFSTWLTSLGFVPSALEQPGVPETFFHTNSEILAGYLRGLFDAAAEVQESRLVLRSTSRRLLLDVQKLLCAFGISVVVSCGDALFELSVRGQSLRRFAAHIGFDAPTKDTELGNLVAATADGAVDGTVTLTSYAPCGSAVTYNLAEPLNHSYVVDSIVVRNCSEYTHVDDTACNLASFNLVKFYDDENAHFDAAAFTHAVRLWTITLEIHVAMSHYPARVIAEKSYRHRTLGLGYANLGALLMRAGLAYDSAEARAAMGAITALLHNRAYATSAELALALGPCLAWEENKSAMARVLHNHRRAAYGSKADAGGVGPYESLAVTPMDIDHDVLATTPFANLSTYVTQAADDAQAGVQTGYRNMQVSVLAPTGCITDDSLVTTNYGLQRLSALGDTTGPQWQSPALANLQAQSDEGPQEITQFFVNGYAEIVELTSDSGRTLRGTPEHRVKVVTEDGSWQWVRLADVRAGMIVPISTGLLDEPRPVALDQVELVTPPTVYRDSVRTPLLMSPELAELVGRTHAANRSSKDAIVLAHHCSSRELFGSFQRTLLSLFGATSMELTYGENDDSHLEATASLRTREVIEWWFVNGLYTDELHVPKAVLDTNDPDVYRAYLRGLFTGSTTTCHPYFASVHASLLNDARVMLGALGIKVTASPGQIAITSPYYQKLFADQIGHIDVDTTSDENEEWIPLSVDLANSLSVRDPDSLESIRRFEHLVAVIEQEQCTATSTCVTRTLAGDLYEVTGDERLAHALSFLYETITADAQIVGSALTYDLSVPSNVTYVANGFVSHNTIGLVMSCDTTGVEPDFALVKIKKLAGGGYMRIINSSVEPALRRLGYTDEQIGRILRHALGTKTLNANTPVNTERLRAKGLSDAAILAAEAALEDVSQLAWAFAPHVVGEDTYRAHRVDDNDPESLLRALGFSVAEIIESDTTICGHLTLEGAVDLRPEHAAIFDCAVECGDGTRSISWSGHVAALAAVAPHISGSVSKTVNLPRSATVEDVEKAHLTAYRSGVKCVAIYRDGSKVAQPLSSAGTEESSDELTVSYPPIEPGMSPAQYYAEHPVPRFRPQNPRPGMTWRLEIGGEELYLRVSTYNDGHPSEIFLDWGRQGSTLRGMTSALSIALSHALQRGMPLEDIVNAFRGQSFEPNGIVRGHDNLKMADSVVDAVARVLGHFFLGRDDLVQVPGGLKVSHMQLGAPLMSERPASPPPAQLDNVEIEKAQSIVKAGQGKRLYDRKCSNCGSSKMLQAGTCFVCTECSETTGCS